MHTPCTARRYKCSEHIKASNLNILHPGIHTAVRIAERNTDMSDISVPNSTAADTVDHSKAEHNHTAGRGTAGYIDSSERTAEHTAAGRTAAAASLPFLLHFVHEPQHSATVLAV